jgi:predicted Zn-dependent peptidase
MPLKHTVEEVKLKNGARGLLIFVPGTTAVSYVMQFRAGNLFARSPRISQVAHILEHMAFGPNAKFKSLEAFSQEFTKNGAFNNAHTGSISMTYEALAAIMEWDRILELQRLAITQPTYTQENFESEKKNVREELLGYMSNDDRLLWQNVMHQAGLKRWFEPAEIKSVDKVKLDDIREHYKRTHTSHNMRFVIAGDLQKNRSKLIKQLEAWSLPKGKEFPIAIQKAHSTGLVHIKRKNNKNLNFRLFLFLNRGLTRREMTAFNTLSHILTGTFHSRIWGAARSRGLSYSMGCYADSDVDQVTEWGLWGGVSLANAPDLFKLVIEQLKDVSENGVTEDELAKAKEYRLGSLQMGEDTVGSLSSWYERYYFSDGTIDKLDAMPGLINGTTATEIRDLMRELLQSGVWSFAGAGDITKVELQKHYDLFAKELIEG